MKIFAKTSLLIVRNNATSAKFAMSTSDDLAARTYDIATSTNQLTRKASKFAKKPMQAIKNCQNSVPVAKRAIPSQNVKRNQPKSPKSGSNSLWESQKGPRTYQGPEKGGINPKKRKYTHGTGN